jgi:imidazolonepropionase-like amidohydrolase
MKLKRNFNKQETFAIGALLCLGLVSGFVRHASAQQSASVSVQTMSAPPGVYVIRNARVVTVSGADIDRGMILIRNGRIEAVGMTINAPAGAQEIDASGLIVYPGMMDAGTNMGLTEISAVGATVDTNELGDLNPNVQAIVAINPHTAHVDVTRVAGVTNVLSMPSGGLISGQAAIINLNGTTGSEMSIVRAAALVMSLPQAGGGGGFFQQTQAPPSQEALTAREQQTERLRKMLRDAEAYGRAQDAYRRDPGSVPRPDTDVALASLVPYVRGERPVLFRADRESDIRAAIRFAEEMKLKAIILGGDDAWKVASLLKAKNVPVILTGVLDMPLREDDPYDVHYGNAAALQQAGVRFCISTGDSGAHVRDLPFQAGMAAAFGLPRTEALKAVTLYPAQIMGVSDRLGSIEAGKLANLVVTDGDLLEARTNVRYLFIGGRQIPLVSRHTQLYETFKDRVGGKQ